MLTEQRISELYRLYSKSLFVFIYKIIHDSGHSEDILQESFANLIAYSSKYIIADINIKSFLYKTAKNLALNYLKRKKTINFISLSEVRLDSPYIMFNHNFNDDDSVIPIIFSKFEQSIAPFKKQTREIFGLKILENLSDKEIAVRLNISTRTVRRKFLEVKNFLKLNFHYQNLLEEI